MRKKVMLLASLAIPVWLVVLAAWCMLSKDRHFPWIGAMIKQAERQENDLSNKIRQQRQIMAEREPAVQELFRIRENSFSNAEDISGMLRGRVERTLSASGAIVRTIATPRKIRSVGDLELYEITFTAEAKTNEMTTVMQEFGKPPVLLWRTLAIRPNNVLKPEFLNLSVAIAAVGFPAKPSAPEEENE